MPDSIAASEPIFDIDNFRLILFQPEDSFYHLDFEQRLEVLVKKVNAAKDYAKQFPDQKCMFVAPEYLFKDFSQQADKQYFSQEQKKKFKEKLVELSQDTDLIIAPGTFCWAKVSKADQDFHYRNMIYFFHKGRVEKYKKTHFHPRSDIDFVPGKSGEDLVYKFDRRATLFRAGGDSAVKDINDISMGIEICYDTVSRHLRHQLSSSPTKKIDVHLIVADGVDRPTLINKENVLLIKVERCPAEFSNVIGTVKKTGKLRMPFDIEPAMRSDQIAEDIYSYKFKSVEELKSRPIPR